ncbi:MAG: hypothetical protein H0U91_10200 [Rubrobacter sp.]|nr:hypothetical protein [Rubrobacter sp.]
MRVLIAYGGSHRSYGEALGHALRRIRPGAAVSVVRAEDLGAEVSHFDPHVVVCDRPNGVDPGGRAAWARLSDDPGVPSEFCVGGRRRRLKNPDFGELLRMFDEAEELVRGGLGPGAASPPPRPYSPYVLEGAFSGLRSEGLLSWTLAICE